MRVFSPALRLLRGLTAVMLLLGLWANTASAAPSPIAPAWLAVAICHGDPGSDAPSPNKAVLHQHCAWCQSVGAITLPPAPAAVAQPALIGTVALPAFTSSDIADRPLFSHAPRGPPAIV